MASSHFITDYFLSFFRVLRDDANTVGKIDFSPDSQPLPDNFIWSRTLGRYSRHDLHRRTGLGKLIYMAKSKACQEAADRLVEIIIQNLSDDPPPFRPEVVTIVPDTEINRPFMPVPYIAQKLADFWGADAILDCLGPVRLEKPQKKRTPDERKGDIEARYFLRDKSRLSGHTVLIFDDIYGTGQSLREAVKLLVDAGSKAVLAMTIARIGDL